MNAALLDLVWLWLRVLAAAVVLWWVCRGGWGMLRRFSRYTRLPTQAVYLAAPHAILTVGDVVTIRGRADDGEVFQVERKILELNSQRVTLAAFLVVLALLVPSTARAADDEPHAVITHVAIAAYIAASGADLSTTMYAIGSRTGQEGNPLFAPFVNTPWASGVVKMGVAAATAWGLVKLHESHPKIALIAAISGTVYFSAIAAHNARISGGAR